MRASELVNGAVVEAEAAMCDEGETKAFVETAGAGVFAEWIDEDRVDGRIGEAARDREAHHFGAKATVEGVGFADPDIDRAMAGCDVAPVTGVFASGIDDFEEADGARVDFGDEGFAPRGCVGESGFPVPVVVGVGGDDVRLFVPAAEERNVGEGGGAKGDGGQAGLGSFLQEDAEGAEKRMKRGRASAGAF